MFDKLMSQDFEIVLNADWADLIKRIKPDREVGKFILSSKSEEGNIIWSNSKAKVKVVIDYDTINLQGKNYTHTVDVCEDIGSLPEMLFKDIDTNILDKLIPSNTSKKGATFDAMPTPVVSSSSDADDIVSAYNTFHDKFETPSVDNPTKAITPYSRDDAKDIAAAFRVYYGHDEEIIADDDDDDAPLSGSVKSIDFRMTDSDEFGLDWKADIVIDSNYGDVSAELSGTISYYGDFKVYDTSYYTDEDVDSFLDDIVEDICKVKALSLLEWYSDQDLDLFLKDTNLDEDEYKDIFKNEIRNRIHRKNCQYPFKERTYRTNS